MSNQPKTPGPGKSRRDKIASEGRLAEQRGESLDAADQKGGQTAERAEHEVESEFADMEQGPRATAEDVLHAFRKGRADAIEAAERTLPVVKRSVSKGLYVFCYYLAFGAVYTAEMAMAAVPEDSAIRHGFRDGAAAARDVYAHRKSTRGTYVPDAVQA